MNPLQKFIVDERESKSHLLMTHVVYGYPSIEKSLEIMQLMLDQGVGLLEVQFPFSDPVADGPTITTACHHALEQKPDLTKCIGDITKLAKNNPASRVLLMSYLNPLWQLGFENLAEQLVDNISGIIIPDLPIDHASMLKPVQEKNVSPIWLITPDMTDQRIRLITEQASGMLYCVSRSGVTGQVDSEMTGVQQYLTRVRQFTHLPLGVGFGIDSVSDLQSLDGHADIAIIGSAFLNAFNEGGMKGLTRKLTELLGDSLKTNGSV